MKLYQKVVLAGLAIIVIFAGATQASACTTLVIGNHATKDGSTIIARNEDNATNWAKHFVVHNQTSQGPTHYLSKGNGFTITLSPKQQRYTATPDWTSKHGTYGEDGINESNVAMSATESTNSNKRATQADPFIKKGISEDAMLDVTLPFIHSARQGVQRLGKMISKFGAAESDGIVFSDKNEIWYMEIGAGHQWAAIQIPANYYAIIPNQLSIGKLVLNNSKKCLISKGLITFIKRHHLSGYKMREANFARAFGTNDKQDATDNTPRIWDGQRLLTPSRKQNIQSRHLPLLMKPDKKVTINKVSDVLSSHFSGTKYDSKGRWVGKYRPINMPMNDESHILQIRKTVPKNIAGIQWLAMASPDTSVYVPFYTNINATPQSYQIGTDHYDPNSAFWTYKLTSTLVQPYPTSFTTQYIKPIQKAVENHMQRALNQSDQVAEQLTSTTALQNYLTASNQQKANFAQNKFKQLNAKLITQSTSEIFKELHIHINKG